MMVISLCSMVVHWFNVLGELVIFIGHSSILSNCEPVMMRIVNVGGLVGFFTMFLFYFFLWLISIIKQTEILLFGSRFGKLFRKT